MRYPAEEKLEIIGLVERSARPAKWTLDKLGVPRRTFYRWYDRYLTEGADGLVDRAPMPKIVWNKIPDNIREDLHTLALDEPELSPRELAVKFTDTKGYFVSESSVYRLLKSYDLISSPAFIVMKAASEFRDKTTAINQLWQTDFTYFKIIGWGWMYLSTILDDFSRYIISWKLCSTMKTTDVTDTLEMALTASGSDQATVLHKPRLLSDNGASYISESMAGFIKAKARSNAGTRRSKIASCSKTTSCRATWNAKSKPSLSITTIIATTRHLETSRLPTPTLGEYRQSSDAEKGSSKRQSNTDACNTAKPSHNINNEDE